MRILPTPHRDADPAEPSARVVSSRARWMMGIAVAGIVLSPPRPLAGQAPESGTNNTADVQFMQGMIAHHAQALAMVAMISTNTTRPELQMIGERIRISQQDEIGMMQRWLTAHHEVVPILDSNNVAHMPPGAMPGMQMSGTTMMMPGMLTAEQMTQLANAKGTDFDTLFLKGMIQHHEGALLMVKDLFSATGSAQTPDVFTFASGADADQRAEIKRMQIVLAAITGRKS
jgi:uncharacterized protein (DUF305 family)